MSGRHPNIDMVCPNCKAKRKRSYYRTLGRFLPLGWFCVQCGIHEITIN